MINVYPSLSASIKAERELKQHLDRQGFLKWNASLGEFSLYNMHQLADLEHQAERKRMEAKRKRDRPMLLERMISAIGFVYNVSEEDLARTGFKTDQLNDARDHLAWMARRDGVEEIHLRRLFSCHHSTITNWRHRFSPARNSQEVKRVDDVMRPVA